MIYPFGTTGGSVRGRDLLKDCVSEWPRLKNALVSHTTPQATGQGVQVENAVIRKHILGPINNCIIRGLIIIMGRCTECPFPMQCNDLQIDWTALNWTCANNKSSIPNRRPLTH